MTRKLHQVLKFIALLVFSFEMLAPAFIAESSAKRNSAHYIINKDDCNQNQLYCLIAEELGVGEEDGEGKECVSLFEFYFESVLTLPSIRSTQVHRFFSHELKNDLSRPLFILHRLLLI